MDMRIGSAGRISPVAKYQETQRSGKAAGSKQPFQTADTLNISSDARMFASAMKAARETPDVRMDLVESARERIANGTYTINSRAIAEKMLDLSV